MNIVMLAAGLSKRMGKTNKLLIPCFGTTMINHCALTALKYLETLNEESHLIVVTGYRHRSTEKALETCRLFVEQTKAPIIFTVVKNPDYEKGQFTSVKAGVKELKDGENFFISLADMPFIKAEHYSEISSALENHDAIRPKVNGVPGHPVFLKSSIKDAILSAKKTEKVSDILKNYDLFEYETDNTEMIADIDNPDDISCCLSDSVR